MWVVGTGNVVDSSVTGGTKIVVLSVGGGGGKVVDSVIGSVGGGGGNVVVSCLKPGSPYSGNGSGCPYDSWGTIGSMYSWRTGAGGRYSGALCGI